MRGFCARAAVVVVAVLLTTSVGANAVHAEPVPGTHRCQEFGVPSVSGDEAVHCADVFRGRNVDRDVTMSGQGQSYCQRPSGTLVRCQGISQTVKIRNNTTGQSLYSDFFCGSFGGGACPSTSRFQNYSPAFRATCGHRYQAVVNSRISYVGGGLAVSSDFVSFEFQYNC